MFKEQLQQGLVIPACPLALTAERRLDERRQRALLRYYSAAGVGGIAVAVHTTQFEIRDNKYGLFKPILELANEEMTRLDTQREKPLVRIAGIIGSTSQAIEEAQFAVDCGYHAGLLSLAALKEQSEEQLLHHCKTIGECIPLVGFYLQPAVGGRELSYSFWRAFAELPSVIAIKIAPFNRYKTLDVMRAVAASGRKDVALYTGNDDNIVMDLLTPYSFRIGDEWREYRMVGGLLGHWSVWTRSACELLVECQEALDNPHGIPKDLIQKGVEITDCNAAFFDAANGYAGVIAGIHEVLHRQGLLEGIWCLNPHETLGPGQDKEIDRVYQMYPHLNDDYFVQTHLEEWLS
jgi:hypothetical protein